MKFAIVPIFALLLATAFAQVYSGVGVDAVNKPNVGANVVNSGVGVNNVAVVVPVGLYYWEPGLATKPPVAATVSVVGSKVFSYKNGVVDVYNKGSVDTGTVSVNVNVGNDVVVVPSTKGVVVVGVDKVNVVDTKGVVKYDVNAPAGVGDVTSAVSIGQKTVVVGVNGVVLYDPVKNKFGAVNSVANVKAVAGGVNRYVVVKNDGVVSVYSTVGKVVKTFNLADVGVNVNDVTKVYYVNGNNVVFGVTGAVKFVNTASKKVVSSVNVPNVVNVVATSKNGYVVDVNGVVKAVNFKSGVVGNVNVPASVGKVVDVEVQGSSVVVVSDSGVSYDVNSVTNVVNVPAVQPVVNTVV